MDRGISLAMAPQPDAEITARHATDDARRNRPRPRRRSLQIPQHGDALAVDASGSAPGTSGSDGMIVDNHVK